MDDHHVAATGGFEDLLRIGDRSVDLLAVLEQPPPGMAELEVALERVDDRREDHIFHLDRGARFCAKQNSCPRMRYRRRVRRMYDGAAKVFSYHCAELAERPKPDVLCKPVDSRL
ncbi:hypothetical protein ATY76_29225 [Rhizobium sp. R339]|nr:hypothetical protein ATY76_29225 [Rhizobium sp. R339]